MIVFKNAAVYTMTEKGILENGFVIVEQGKIQSVGGMDALAVPEGAQVMDLEGKMLLPGFVDAHCHLGLFGDALGFEGEDGNEDSDPCTPQLRALDGINPLDRCFAEAREAGVTTVVVSPGSANVIGGQIAAMKTYGKLTDKMVLSEPLAIKFALGENPKSVYHGKEQTPVTRMATVSIIREMLYKAERYRQDCRDAQEDEELDMPDYDAKCEALIPLLERKIPAHFHAHRCDDIFTVLRIAKEFELDYVLIHATQGYRLAAELAAEGARVLSGPLLCERSKPELQGLTPKAPALLHKAGVKVAIITDHPEIPIQYLPLCAGLAVREGMDHMEALKAITLYPAEICGLQHSVGAIRERMDADLTVFSEDPLSVYSKPDLVVCGGNIQRPKEETGWEEN